MAQRVRIPIFVALVATFIVLAPASVASAQALAISTQPSLYPGFDPAVSDYVVRCTAGTPVQVDVSAPPGTEVDVDGQGFRDGDFTTTVSLGEGQGFRIASDPGSTYYVRCLPADFPVWTFQRSGQPQAEWYMVSPFSNTYGAAFDGNGVPVWWFKGDRRSRDFRLLPNGNFAFARVNNFGVDERRLDGSPVRTFFAVGATTDAHEVLLLPNGNYIVLAQRNVAGQSFCGLSNVTIADLGVQEIAPDGSLVWSWWPSEHIPLSELPSAWCSLILTQGTPYDVYHANSVEPDGDGYLVSFRHLDAVYRINRSDGSVDWKLGGIARTESLTVLNDPFALGGDLFRGQHDARVLPDGTVTVHDNGYHPNFTRPPRGVRYAIDTNARTASLVEQKDDPDPALATPLCCGSARVLSGGNWVISWGNSNRVTELTPSGSRVFSLTFASNGYTYRAQPVPYGTLSRDALRAGMDAQYPRGYVRAKGASPFRVALVPAFGQCMSPDLTHGEPLAFGSCSSPTATSGFLTVGTPDANGAPSNAVGSVLYIVVQGDPSTEANEADVSVLVQLSDVRRSDDLSDYTGEVQLRQGVRITDLLNGSLQNEAATGFDTDLSATVPCAATASSTVGASCSLSSSFNAILPGSVIEGKRATWQLERAQVFDGGANGTAGSSGATLFETQGLFVP
jgi:hypothetical protein